MRKYICPLCGSEIDLCESVVSEETLQFLTRLSNDGTLDSYLRVSKVYIDIMKQGASNTAIVTKLLSILKSEVKGITESEISKLADELPKKINEALGEKVSNTDEMKDLLETALKETIPDEELLVKMIQETLKDYVPDSGQIKVLSESLPSLIEKVSDLLRKQEIPKIKGDEAEKELHIELCDSFPEDDIERLGGPGRTDIIASPRQNGITIHEKVMIEKKENASWSRAHLDQLKNHMEIGNSRYGILSVKTMPKGSNSFLLEYIPGGVIFIANKTNSVMAYGAIRAILFTVRSLQMKNMSLQTVLTESRMQEALVKAFSVSEHLENIKKKSKKIAKDAQVITEESNVADDLLKMTLAEMQKSIEKAISTLDTKEVEAEVTPLTS